MGILERRRERQAARHAEAEARAEEARHAAREHQAQVFAWCLARARAVNTGTEELNPSPVPLKKGERALYALDRAGLVEPRRGPGHWQGGSQGVSVHVPGTKSMRYRVGSTRGSYTQGDENPTIIDQGAFTITDQRAVFVGTKQSREWAWAKLVGFHDDDGANWTGIAVSNRQKISGVSYQRADAVAVRFYLELAVAAANDRVGEIIAELEQTTAPAIDVPAQSVPPTSS